MTNEDKRMIHEGHRDQGIIEGPASPISNTRKMKENKKAEPSNKIGIEFICPNCFKRGYTPNLKEPSDMIPLSVIDAKIKEVEELAKISDLSYERQWVLTAVVLPMLEEIKKEAIIPEANKPLSSLQEIYDLIPWNMTPGCNEAKKRLRKLLS